MLSYEMKLSNKQQIPALAVGHRQLWLQSHLQSQSCPFFFADLIRRCIGLRIPSVDNVMLSMKDATDTSWSWKRPKRRHSWVLLHVLSTDLYITQSVCYITRVTQFLSAPFVNQLIGSYKPCAAAYRLIGSQHFLPGSQWSLTSTHYPLISVHYLPINPQHQSPYGQ